MKLGLIGSNIQRSRMPLLQRLAGERHGIAIDYLLLDQETHDPAAFDRAFDRCVAEGYDGINVTHPFKERAAARVTIDDPMVRAIGAVNTVLLSDNPRGFNTDHTGFLRAWRGRFGEETPGVAALVGTGGVGRAIAFALLALGADEIRLFDVDDDRARALAAALEDGMSGIDFPARIVVADSSAAALADADGLVNGTPVGMHGTPGCPVPQDLLDGRRWVFDAVYTPMQTELLRLAEARGIPTLSGFYLFMGQGVDGFEIFTGKRLSEDDVAALEGEVRATF